MKLTLLSIHKNFEKETASTIPAIYDPATNNFIFAQIKKFSMFGRVEYGTNNNT